jgi:hypothetical protein
LPGGFNGKWKIKRVMGAFSVPTGPGSGTVIDKPSIGRESEFDLK